MRFPTSTRERARVVAAWLLGSGCRELHNETGTWSRQVGYGVVIPRFRVSTKDIAEVWRPNRTFVTPVPEKSVPSRDEDAVTLSIDAATIRDLRSDGHTWLNMYNTSK
jgi:hypothetical protein